MTDHTQPRGQQWNGAAPSGPRRGRAVGAWVAVVLLLTTFALAKSGPASPPSGQQEAAATPPATTAPATPAPASDRDLPDPLPAIKRPATNAVVDEARDDNLERPNQGERTFGHHRYLVDQFTADGNWKDIGTAVAADQLAGMTPVQIAEFMRVTGATREEIRPGQASLMQLSPTRDWRHMKAPRPKIRYRQIDISRIGPLVIVPEWLVIHYTAGVSDTTDAIWKLFNDKHGIPSTQFVVGKPGDILQMMPETQMCDGTLDFNDHSIQIEICGDFRLEKETDQEFQATVALVRYLQRTYHIPDTHIISHRQVDNNFGHVGRKPDPTFRFMNRLYDALRKQ
jgi:hypothetical protein